MKLWTSLLALLLFLGGLSGCKRDQTPPTFSLISPTGSLSDSATAVIQVKGQASDQSGLNEVQAYLYSTDPQIYGQEGYADAFLSQDLTGSSSDFSFAFQLGTKYFRTGMYTLRISVNDKDGFSSSLFFDVNLTEVPLRLIRPLYAVLQPGGDYHLYLPTNGGTTIDTASLGSDLTGFYVDNRNQALATTRSSGLFDIYRVTDLGRDCQRSAAPLGSLVPCTGLLPAKLRYYVSMDYAPYVMVLGTSCNSIASLPDVTVKPTSLGAGVHNLYVGGTAGSSIYKIDRYDLFFPGLAEPAESW
jgi:hypothetical protein